MEEERDKPLIKLMFEFDTNAALIATVCAIPFAIVASYFGIASSYGIGVWGRIAFLRLASLIYLLGLPLTWVAYRLLTVALRLAGDKNLMDSVAGAVLSVVILDIIFVVQWIIWSQLIVIVLKTIAAPVVH